MTTAAFGQRPGPDRGAFGEPPAPAYVRKTGVQEEYDGRGRTVLITGANSGIGLEASKQLARAGCQVVMACRSMEKATEAVAAVHSHLHESQGAGGGGGGGGGAEPAVLDLSSLASVRAFAAEYLARGAPLDVLVCNAVRPHSSILSYSCILLSFLSSSPICLLLSPLLPHPPLLSFPLPCSSSSHPLLLFPLSSLLSPLVSSPLLFWLLTPFLSSWLTGYASPVSPRVTTSCLGATRVVSVTNRLAAELRLRDGGNAN